MDKSLIEQALNDCDRDTTAEELAEVLMDDTISTYNTFEEIAAIYLDEKTSDEFRTGVDFALRELTHMDLAGIAREVLEKQAKKTED